MHGSIIPNDHTMSHLYPILVLNAAKLTGVAQFLDGSPIQINPRDGQKGSSVQLTGKTSGTWGQLSDAARMSSREDGGMRGPGG